MADGRRQSGLWMGRPPGTYPNVSAQVPPYYRVEAGDDAVEIVVYDRDGRVLSAVALDRRLARLLAKRVNQCLDATVKS